MERQKNGIIWEVIATHKKDISVVQCFYNYSDAAEYESYLKGKGCFDDVSMTAKTVLAESFFHKE